MLCLENTCIVGRLSFQKYADDRQSCKSHSWSYMVKRGRRYPSIYLFIYLFKHTQCHVVIVVIAQNVVIAVFSDDGTGLLAMETGRRFHLVAVVGANELAFRFAREFVTLAFEVVVSRCSNVMRSSILRVLSVTIDVIYFEE